MERFNPKSQGYASAILRYPDKNGSRVRVRFYDEVGKKRSRTIGYMTVNTPGNQRMVPNDYFKEKFQASRSPGLYMREMYRTAGRSRM